MTKKITIAIDAMGGDNSPEKTINGIEIFLKKNSSKNDFKLNLFGDKKKIQEKLDKYKISSKLINIIHTENIVSDEERLRPENSEVERLCACNKKAKELLEWQPSNYGIQGLEIGLSKTIDWFLNPENLIKYKSDIYNI